MPVRIGNFSTIKARLTRYSLKFTPPDVRWTGTTSKSLIFSLLLWSCFVPTLASATSSRIGAARAQLSSLSTALNMFEVEHGRYPTTAEGLQALVVRPSDIPADKWHPYLDPPAVPLDPWGHPYVYRCPGVHKPEGFDLYSCGPDGVSKTGGADPDDISNWVHQPSGYDFQSPRLTIGTFDIAIGAIASVLFLLSLATLWRHRGLKSEGNWHGVFALLWASLVFPPMLLMAPTLRRFEDYYTLSFVLVLCGSWPPALLLGISGYRRGRFISQLFGLLAILCVLAFLVLFLKPQIRVSDDRATGMSPIFSESL